MIDIENLRELPKLYRVISVQLSVLRPCRWSGECDSVVERKVRRVLKDCGGWKWQIVKEWKDQHEWDWFLEQDQECLDNIEIYL